MESRDLLHTRRSDESGRSESGSPSLSKDFTVQCKKLQLEKEKLPDHQKEWIKTSFGTKAEWTNSLNRGRLVKGVKETPRLYSRLRELTTYTHLPLECVLSPRGRDQHGSNTAGSFVTEGQNGGDADKKKLTSVVIVEDVSVPPRPSEEAAAVPMSFTDEDFFTFLSSRDWGGGANTVRLISGRILYRLLTALYVLEARGKIHTHNARAFLNNGYWKTPPKEEIRQELVYEPPPPPPSKAKDWINEKILVNMVYYGRATNPSKSSQETINAQVKPQTPFEIRPDVAKLPVKSPECFRMHPVDDLKLPSGEHINYESQIQHLKCELVALNTKRDMEAEQHKPTPGGGKGKDTKHSAEGIEKEPTMKETFKRDEPVEDIAEDLCFVEKSKAVKPALSRISEESKADLGNIFGRTASRDLEEKKDSDAVSVPASHTPKKSDSRSDKGESGENHGVEKNDILKKMDSGTSKDITEHSEAVDEDLDSTAISGASEIFMEGYNGEKNRLNLTGNELYVSALYKERGENSKSITYRLHQANKQRLKQRQHTANDINNKFIQSRDVDLHTRFKSLGAAKERERIKSSAPTVPSVRNTFNRPPAKMVALEQSWSRYYKHQEEMEMKTATDNSMEKACLKRVVEAKPQNNHVSSDKDRRAANKSKSKYNNTPDIVGQSKSKYNNAPIDLGKSKSRNNNASGDVGQSKSRNKNAPDDLEKSKSRNNNASGDVGQSKSRNKNAPDDVEKSKSRNKNAPDDLEKSKSRNKNNTDGKATNNTSFKHGEDENNKPRSILKTNSNRTQKLIPTKMTLVSANMTKHNDIMDQLGGPNQKLSSCDLLPTIGSKSVHFPPCLNRVVEIQSASSSDETNVISDDESPKLLDAKSNYQTKSFATRLPPLERSSSFNLKKAPKVIEFPSNINSLKHRISFQSRSGKRNPIRMNGATLLKKDVNDNAMNTFASGRNQNDNSGSISQEGEEINNEAESEQPHQKAENNDGEKAETEGDEVGEQEKEPRVDEKVKEKELQSRISVVTSPKIELSKSAVLRQDLARFDAGCDCYECDKDDLEALRPVSRGPPFSYPLKLGCMKKSLYCLRSLKQNRALTSAFEIPSRGHQGLDDESLRREVLRLIDGMVVRKDILSSSLGNTFTTIVFIKP